MRVLSLPVITCCIILLFSTNCSNKSTEPDDSKTLRSGVLVLEDGGTQDSIYSILLKAGIAADSGGLYYLHDGSNLQDYKVIIFLNGVVWSSGMPNATQQAIRNFVEDGGVLFSIEWISWSGATNQLINDMLPVHYNGSWSVGSETYSKETVHPISSALPDTFSVPPDWSYSWTVLDTTAAKNAVLIFSASKSGAAVALGDFGSGQAIHWNMGGHYSGTDIWTPQVRRLLVNIVTYALNTSGN